MSSEGTAMSPDVEARRGIEGAIASGRLIGFSDGVVAIGITLLILPLAAIDLPPSSQWPNNNPLQWLWEQQGQLITSFLTSFFIIAIFWLVHHNMFSQVERVDATLSWCDLLWLFGIVVFPFPSNVLGQAGISTPVMAFYIGTMFFISLMLAIMSAYLRAHPELLSSAGQIVMAGSGTFPRWIFTVYLGLLLGLCFIHPGWASWALSGLIVLGALQGRLLRRSEPTVDPPSGNQASS